LGLDFNLADVPRTPGLDRDDVLAFSESLGRFVVEVAPDDAPKFEADLLGLPMARVGHVRDDDQVQITGLDGRLVIRTDLKAVGQAWRGHLSGTSFYTCDNLD
jgi:phosphoribosylformylglycinamidine (FGAM) synthase-like enzyme